MKHSIQSLNLQAWVDAAPEDKRQFRQAVHLVLLAIGTSVNLRAQMVMKGGMLMAIRYNSVRFTRDADFSTRDLYQVGDEQAIVKDLCRELDLVNADSDYDTICLLQTAKLKPKGPIKTFPTLSINVGYAARTQVRAVQRLKAKQSPNVVEIDVSFNEAILDAELLRLSDGKGLQVYSMINLIAEKYRSLLQQPVRNRNRRQDVYDLWVLVSQLQDFSPLEKSQIKVALEQSCATKGISVTDQSLANPIIRQMSSVGYQDLRAEVAQDLPDFDLAYQCVQDFYEGLPWREAR